MEENQKQEEEIEKRNSVEGKSSENVELEEKKIVEAEPVEESSAKEEVTVDDDVEKNKGMAILAYILFFIPLLTEAKNSKFAMFHANQSLVLLITGVVISVVGTIIPFLGWFIIIPFGTLFVVILWIMGLINASKGEMKELPLLGGIHILDKK